MHQRRAGPLTIDGRARHDPIAAGSLDAIGPGGNVGRFEVLPGARREGADVAEGPGVVVLLVGIGLRHRRRKLDAGGIGDAPWERRDGRGKVDSPTLAGEPALGPSL